MNRTLIALLIAALAMPPVAQTTLRRGRAEGFYVCESANTPGSGNVWATGGATGYIWDAITDLQTRSTQPVPQGFLNVRLDGGIMDVASIKVESQVLALLRGKKVQFGNIRGAAKFTYPNNKDIRFIGPGIEIGYVHSFIKEFNSLGGFRDGGTGFSSTGLLVEGGSIELKSLVDFDLLAKITWLPLKGMVNGGLRIPLDSEFRDLSEYLMSAGISYVGLNVDVFLEYSFAGLINRNIYPKSFTKIWSGWSTSKTWEVAFSENPMYLGIGGRYRYPSGVVLYACIPLLLSANQGSTLEYSGKSVIAERWPDEGDRDVSDGFDPWYAKWKLILRMSFPFHYRQTGAEMRRNFLLLKGRKQRKKIDIDERLKILEGSRAPGGQPEGGPEKDIDEKQRLEEIKKRRKEIQESK